MIKYEYEPWTIGKIKAVTTPELDKRVNDLIGLKERVINDIQIELDVIYLIIELRIKATTKD